MGGGRKNKKKFFVHKEAGGETAQMAGVLRIIAEISDFFGVFERKVINMGEIFLNVEAITSGNWFNVKEMIIDINELLNNYGVNGAARVMLPTKPEFANGIVLVGKIFVGKEKYTFSFFSTGNAAVSLVDNGETKKILAKGEHLEILFKFFDFVGSELRVNIKRRKEREGILCEDPIICEQGGSLNDGDRLLKTFEYF